MEMTSRKTKSIPIVRTKAISTKKSSSTSSPLSSSLSSTASSASSSAASPPSTIQTLIVRPSNGRVSSSISSSRLHPSLFPKSTVSAMNTGEMKSTVALTKQSNSRLLSSSISTSTTASIYSPVFSKSSLNVPAAAMMVSSEAVKLTTVTTTPVTTTPVTTTATGQINENLLLSTIVATSSLSSSPTSALCQSSLTKSTSASSTIFCAGAIGSITTATTTSGSIASTSKNSIATTTLAPYPSHHHNQHHIPSDILDDLASRFIINVPDDERNNLIRICFQIELAHWFYLDFFCSTDDKKLTACGMKQFAIFLFKHIPFLKVHLPIIDKILEDWKQYKLTVPTYGAILMSEDLKYVLLVQSYWAKSSWGFPKGKVNEHEDPIHCATREVFEETGYDITKLIIQTEYIEAIINYQYTRLYLVRNVPLKTHFMPRTRKEIKCCEWFAIDSLPLNKNDALTKQNLGINANSFFMIMPFIKRLKKWANDHRSNIDNSIMNHTKLKQSNGLNNNNMNNSLLTAVKKIDTKLTFKTTTGHTLAAVNNNTLNSIGICNSNNGKMSSSKRQRHKSMGDIDGIMKLNVNISNINNNINKLPNCIKQQQQYHQNQQHSQQLTSSSSSGPSNTNYINNDLPSLTSEQNQQNKNREKYTKAICKRQITINTSNMNLNNKTIINDSPNIVAIPCESLPTILKSTVQSSPVVSSTVASSTVVSSTIVSSAVSAAAYPPLNLVVKQSNIDPKFTSALFKKAIISKSLLNSSDTFLAVKTVENPMLIASLKLRNKENSMRKHQQRSIKTGVVTFKQIMSKSPIFDSWTTFSFNKNCITNVFC